MNSIQKISVRILLTIYWISYLLQNTIFVDRKKVYAAENPSTTNLVAIFVDKNIYQDIKTNLVRYTTSYIQKKIANSKAIVFPIDTKTFKAHEISQMLENMYFEGLKDESSKLIGTILIWDIPLPVVENNGFIYPSIYPYVDFEQQQFVYDTNKKFFVDNGNPNGQAELRHGMIKFEKISEYNSFFDKVKKYYTSPTTFIDKAIWYDDFIGTKKYFIPENTKYYINSLLFSEDIGYHRFNNTLLNILKDEHNESTLAISNDLQDALQDTQDQDLKKYSQDIASRNDTAKILTTQIPANIPTLALKTSTQEMLKSYDGLISSQFLSKIKDNIAGLARWYKTTEWETFPEYSSTTEKIIQKDNRIVGDLDNNIQPLLIQINDALESGLNTKIQQEKYYVTVPITVSELDFEGQEKWTLQKKCTWKTYNYYENYFFGKNANRITSAEDTNIYKGTFQNLNTISGQNITKPLQSIGGSYTIFSTQIEANRWYDFSNTQEELERYSKYKTNKQSLRQLKCNQYFLWWKRLNICIKPRSRAKNDSAVENKCDSTDPNKQWWCESLTGFAQRNRWGASPLNINSTSQTLENYEYKNAISPIYNIAGAKKVNTTQANANSYKSIATYTSMIQKKFGVGDIQFGSNNVLSLIANPMSNWSTVIFTNQLPTGNGDAPTWKANPPKTDEQTNFFTQFNIMPNHIVYGGKAVLYKVNPGECWGNGNIYTYKTIDSRIKNISPTRNQISDTERYTFKDGSDLEMFYTNVMTNLIQTKNDIISTTNTFSGTESNDITWVITNLNQIKTIIASGNKGTQEITTFNPSSLLSYNVTQTNKKAQERREKNITSAKITEISWRIEKINAGLESLLNYITALNINNVQFDFTDIIQTQYFKNQNVEILDTWKTNITQNLSHITTNTNNLKSTFIQSRGIYNTIEDISNSLTAIQDKKIAIAALQSGRWCAANYYQSICTVLDDIITTLQHDIADINEKIKKIGEYQGDKNEQGVSTKVQPFVEIHQTFSQLDLFKEITQIKSSMETFTVSTNSEKKEKNKGMNLTTQDRPIDNIRNITFQGIGWDLVQFNYPNLYEVEIYKKTDTILTLKTPREIREAIKSYLLNITKTYNALLQAQTEKRNQRYQTRNNQFTFLRQIDPLADPSTHQYQLLSSEYFIDQLVSYLDTLEKKYGTTYIYGQSKPETRDQKLDMIAKVLYYQNSTWPKRMQQENVMTDMKEIKNSFDINHKINNIVETYLTEGNNQGKFITPIYNITGYEIGYINSDGEDYISSQSIPAFIQQIQNIQQKTSTLVKTPVNTYKEASNSSDIAQAQISSCEWVDPQGTALLFDIKTFTSPRMKAMKCWLAQVLKKPGTIKIGFKNALGPVIISTPQDITSTTQTQQNQRKQYGAQRKSPNNDTIIDQAPENIKDTLKGYNNDAIIDIDKTIIDIDSMENSQLKIGMSQNRWDSNIKIAWTGDNCVGISRKWKVLSENICIKKAQEYYNPNTEAYIFDIIVKQKKAWTTALNIEFCPTAGSTCITKQEIINILPWPIKTITLQSPTDIVMQGAEIPIVVNAVDKYGNSIGQNIQAYTISVLSWEGELYDGTSTNTSIQFDNFLKAGFIYQAPISTAKTPQENKAITITVTPNTQNLLIKNTEPSTKIVQKKIIVAKWIVTIDKPKITFDLPKDESEIHYQESNGNTHINTKNLPSFTITVKDKNGNTLDTVANITASKWLLLPWKVTSTKFSPTSDFIIRDGKINITLYPNFKAGNDTVTIKIPGIDPIIIPVNVNPGVAKTVLLTLEKSKMDTTTTNQSKWTIQVVDTRNNKVIKPTTIKLWVIGAAKINTTEFIYTGTEYTYTLNATSPGGEWYIFGYIKDRTLSDQIPWYEKFIVQESLIPKEKLNILYLNLFGTDWWNQRGYFSENNKIINTMTNQSNKLLATTTQLIDPNKIKQVQYIVSPNGQITNINTTPYTLTLENKSIVAIVPEVAKIVLGKSKNFTIKNITDSWAVYTFAKNENTIIYIPEATDSIITGNKSDTSKISINGIDIFDLKKNTIHPSTIITADNEKIGDINTYTMTFNGKNIGKLLIWNNDTIAENWPNIDIQDPIIYGKTSVFSEWSTNSQWLGIYSIASAFTKQWYQSIEDSADGLLGIGFTNNFKNISNFANGTSVWASTLPYGSQFLINFWDPLIERREKNTNIPNTDFDAAIWQTIYTDPNKTIFKVLPIDFNKDGTKDLLVVYTDGVIKLLKNYGGTTPYKNLQEIMIIAEAIKDIKVGDVDGNGYEDIVIITDNKGIVYLNDKGTFTVDGKNICLNINAEPNTKNTIPDDFSTINQLFVEDMDKDGKLDIITNDQLQDIKIFYGWSSNQGANYLSSVSWTCDEHRYTRQKNNYKIIKRFGIKINSDRYIQDNSLIHRKGMEIPSEWIEEEVDDKSTDTTANMSQSQMETLKNTTINDIKNMVANNDIYIVQGAKQLAYVDNPLTSAPIYESHDPQEITYLPINENNDTVSIYKEYVDINWGILRQNDEVVIKTTIISKKYNNKLTYIDQIKWPRKIIKDDANKINSFVFINNNTWWINIDRNWPEWYQFIIDNIKLSSGEKISFSYKAIYQQNVSTTKIDIQDQDAIKLKKYKDTYPDIITNSTDSCQKNRIIFFNEKTQNKRTYAQIYDDIQTEIDNYNSWAQKTQTTQINGLIDQISNTNNLENISNLPGMDTLEPRSIENLLSTSTSQWWLSVNIDTSFIDKATTKVSKKIDTTLQWLCQWFTLGKWWSASCSWVPVPFNQAFLAPGDYQVFGCVPKAPNPLAPLFQTLNKTIGKGLPVLTIPGKYPSPAGYLPIPGIFGLPFKGPTDDFLLGIKWGTWWSQFRLYVVPTLTLWLGMAMCFGPYSVGKAIPKPFRDMGGNCVVFALPPLTTCTKTGANLNTPTTESLGSSMINAAGQGTCNNPPKIGNTIVFVENNEKTITSNTASSPFQIVSSFENTAESSKTNYQPAIPQGNFGGLITIDQDPIHISAAEDYGNTNEQLQEGYQLKKWEKITNKIVGAKTKGLVKCMVQDWSTRQIQYIQNNLTKMTIQLDLPDLSTVFQWFDKIWNLSETYKTINQQDSNEWYIGSTKWKGIGTGELNDATQIYSKQQLNNISQQIGQNPFEAIQQMFSEVPLVNIDTKDINIKIPALTSDDVNKYSNYLQLRWEKNTKILEEWTDMLNRALALCQTVNKTEAQIAKCKDIEASSKKFITFRENSAGIIKSVKQNINVLEKYKQFPTQLYERTHISDRYLTELSALLSDYIGSLTSWTSTNANRFSQYVDALTLLVGSIKTWQAVIDFSVNRSEKCSKCSNDNYGSFSCSLSFLCPKLPIFPIPAFKIPNIYMDMSHIELGMNIVLPKINFVPTKIPLPQIPNLPEPPTIEIDWNILYGLDSNFFKDMSLPTIPVIPEPPTLPEPPSFIPSIQMDLPVLPPAPKIPKIIPEINGILKVATFIGKVFCIVKWGIGLVGEKGVKGKVEQITQRTWNVPIFDYFDLTTKFNDPPLQWFDYKMDAYTTLKFNFDWVYDVFNTIAQTANRFVSKEIEAPTQKTVDKITDKANNNFIVTGILNPIENFDQTINFNSYNDSGMIEYTTAYNQLKQWLLLFKRSTLTDKSMYNKVHTILAMIENNATILPATKEIQQVENISKGIIQQTIKEHKALQEQIKNYDKFIKAHKDNIVLVDEKTSSTQLKAPILTIDSTTKNILQSQEDPTKTYLTLNKKMVQGYLDAINNDGSEKLNMTKTTYNKSKNYLETTKQKIDTALLAYTDTPLSTATTCTNCSTNAESKYSTDISAYVQGVFIESNSGDKNMINTIISTPQLEQVQKTYTTNYDLNNDKKSDILMYDTNTIYVKYANQETEHFSPGSNELTTYYNKFYTYESEHFRNRAITSNKQLQDNTDVYGYITINDITIKVIDKNKEVKNMRTDGQTFDKLQLSWENSKIKGETVDGYILKVSTKIDEKDTPKSFRDFLWKKQQQKYIVALPKNSDYKKWLITIDENFEKKSINLELWDTILAVEYYDQAQKKINITLKDLPRKWLYTSIATLTSTPEELSNTQRKNITFYKKSSPRSNQTVAGMQNLGDTTAPVGDIILSRDLTKEIISTGIVHEWYINTTYTLTAKRTDNVVVSKMIIQKDGKIIGEKTNQFQTGTIDMKWLFFSWPTQQHIDFIAIDQNNNITKQTITVNINTPNIEIIDLKKSGKNTADIIAKISNDLDEGMVIFQRLRNGLRNDIKGSKQNDLWWFSLSPKQTIITGGIFTIGNDIGLYNNQGKEIATINKQTNEIHINPWFENTIKTNVSFTAHIPIIEIKDITTNTVVFQIILPIETISKIQLHQGKPEYEILQLKDKEFGDFTNGYCIKNKANECIIYTNNKGAIYIPGIYTSSLKGEYIFDKPTEKTTLVIKDQSNKAIATLVLQIKTP